MMAMFMDDLLGSHRERDGRPALDLVQLLLLPLFTAQSKQILQGLFTTP
jgi:hypothetical protein